MLVANPSVEEGHTRIPNELLEVLGHTRLSPREWQVLMVLLRDFYGWHRELAVLSLRDLALKTHLSHPHVCDTLRSLESKGLMVKQKPGLKFIPDYDQWRSRNRELPGIGNDCSRNREETFPESGTQGGASTPTPNNEIKKERKKKVVRQRTPNELPSDGLFKVLKEAAYEHFQKIRHEVPLWGKADYVQLARLVKARPRIKVEDFLAHLNSYLTSDDDFFRKQGGSLRFFCYRYDSFQGQVVNEVANIFEIQKRREMR